MHIKRLNFFLILLSLVIALSTFSTPALTANLPEVKADQGLIVFYRMSRMTGKAVRFNVRHADKLIGQLLSGTVLYKHLDPGEHTFWVQGISVDGQDFITINIEAGKAYYVNGKVLMGWPAGRPKFTQMSDSKALADLAKLK